MKVVAPHPPPHTEHDNLPNFGSTANTRLRLGLTHWYGAVGTIDFDIALSWVVIFLLTAGLIPSKSRGGEEGGGGRKGGEGRGRGR